ncbi:MAG: metallophosphoesterase [Haloechinothrix sp.]
MTIPRVLRMTPLATSTLRNERVRLRDFDLAGVNDVTGADANDPPDHERALGGRSTDRPVVLLAHQPIQVDRAESYGVDLQLSGHTHGGQLFPQHLFMSLTQKVVAGLARSGGTQMYVTRGAGFWGPAARVGAPPEVTVLEPRHQPAPS